MCVLFLPQCASVGRPTRSGSPAPQELGHQTTARGEHYEGQVAPLSPHQGLPRVPQDPEGQQKDGDPAAKKEPHTNKDPQGFAQPSRNPPANGLLPTEGRKGISSISTWWDLHVSLIERMKVEWQIFPSPCCQPSHDGNGQWTFTIAWIWFDSWTDLCMCSIIIS